MNPLEQLDYISQTHVPDGEWCRCGSRHPCDARILLSKYVNTSLREILGVTYRHGWNDGVVEVEVLYPDLAPKLEHVRGANRDLSFAPGYRNVRPQEEARRTLDDFIESGESPYGGIWGHGKSYSERADAHGTHYRTADRPLSEEMPDIFFKEIYVPESEFAHAVSVPVCSKHGIEMQRDQGSVGDGYIYFACPALMCGRAGRVPR